MRDPELVQRAERAATALEQAWIHWRQRHGLAAGPLPPVSSYVGYSAIEPWGQPRVVLGVHAEEAERLAAILEGHDCVGPVHAGVVSLPVRRPQEAAARTATGGIPPLPRDGASSPAGGVLPGAAPHTPPAAAVPSGAATAAAMSAVAAGPVRSAPARSAPARTAPARSAPARSAPVRSAPARTAPASLAAAGEAAAGLDAAELPSASASPEHAAVPAASAVQASPVMAASPAAQKVGPAEAGPAEAGPAPEASPAAEAGPIAQASRQQARPAATRPPASGAEAVTAAIRAVRPRTSPEQAAGPAQPATKAQPAATDQPAGTVRQSGQGSGSRWQEKPSAPGDPAGKSADPQAPRASLQPASKLNRQRKPGQRPAGGNWPAVDGGTSATDSTA